MRSDVAVSQMISCWRGGSQLIVRRWHRKRTRVHSAFQVADSMLAIVRDPLRGRALAVSSSRFGQPGPHFLGAGFSEESPVRFCRQWWGTL